MYIEPSCAQFSAFILIFIHTFLHSYSYFHSYTYFRHSLQKFFSFPFLASHQHTDLTLGLFWWSIMQDFPYSSSSSSHIWLRILESSSVYSKIQFKKKSKKSASSLFELESCCNQAVSSDTCYLQKFWRVRFFDVAEFLNTAEHVLAGDKTSTSWELIAVITGLRKTSNRWLCVLMTFNTCLKLLYGVLRYDECECVDYITNLSNFLSFEKNRY